MPQLTATRTWILIQLDEGEDADARRDQTLLRPYGPVRVEIVLRIKPGVA